MNLPRNKEPENKEPENDAIAAPEPEGLRPRQARLEAHLRALAPVAVALSGGVDSGLLYCEARRILGDQATAVVGVSPSLSASELLQARAVAAHLAAPLLEVETHELDREEYRANRGDRCFHCRTELYSRLTDHPSLEAWSLVDGTHADDRVEDRPGFRAARTWGVAHPLRDAGLGKQDIRFLARKRGLPNWARPAHPCLASRVMVGTPVDAETLGRVETLEVILEEHRFRIYRARVDGDAVVVAVGRDELHRLDDDSWRGPFTREALRLGFRRVLVDRAGYGARAVPSGGTTGRVQTADPKWRSEA